MNVSQIINMGELYTSLNRPKDASDMVSDLGSTSPYGHMQLEMVRLLVAMQLGDKAAVATHMDEMREHRADAMSTWQYVLLVSGNLDAAADFLVERLNSDDERSDALTELQVYTHVPTPPGDVA